MKYRHLGKAGLQVSEFSLGSWVTFHTQTGVDDAVEMMLEYADCLDKGAVLDVHTRHLLPLIFQRLHLPSLHSQEQSCALHLRLPPQCLPL